jgi:hypothetical protein
MSHAWRPSSTDYLLFVDFAPNTSGVPSSVHDTDRKHELSPVTVSEGTVLAF